MLPTRPTRPTQPMPPVPLLPWLHGALLEWFDACARDLPWRGAGARGWPVLVSEVMLQQTPVARVRPVFEVWMRRWPSPADLAADSPGEAVRHWGRLGYPRRALRLHAAAVACVRTHGGQVPAELGALRALPGVGEYTAAAVASFAFGGRQVVLDTNVRRVLARLVGGQASAPTGAAAAAERDRAAALLPPTGPAGAARGTVRAPTAPRWNAALMELGALVCTARSPACGRCPVAAGCAWRLAGSPAGPGPARRGPAYPGSDRQARGRLLAAVREADSPVGAAAVAAAWDEPVQRARCLDGLVADGLLETLPRGRYRLPR